MTYTEEGARMTEKDFIIQDLRRENAELRARMPIVRCKDCKHYRPQKKSAHGDNRAYYCNRVVTIKVQPYDFCSYGERKEGAD